MIIKPGYDWQLQAQSLSAEGLNCECVINSDHWLLNEVWTKFLKPRLNNIAATILVFTTQRLAHMHRDLMAWGNASTKLDTISYGRSAIEPHEQDRDEEPVDVLIDVVRDTLDWLSKHRHQLLDAWIEILISSDAPILRRLAVHAVASHPKLTPEARLNWLLNRVGLYSHAEHHEVYRAVAQTYPEAGEYSRQAVVSAVTSYEGSNHDDQAAKEAAAHAQFRWLSWLLQSKPDCPLASTALAPILAAHPRWKPQERPDLTHWHSSVEWVGPYSPWSVEQLLEWKPGERLDDLLYFQSENEDGTSRDGLLANIREACKRSVEWALSLSDSLGQRSQWEADLWSSVIRGLQEGELTLDEWRDALAKLGTPELVKAHAHDIAQFLHAIVRDGGKPFAVELLALANDVALQVWQLIESNELDKSINDWLERAINRPAGKIVEFWITGLSLFMRTKVSSDRHLPENYKQWFTLVIGDTGTKGGLGRCILASQLALLLSLDEAWTKLHIVPLFSDGSPEKFAQCWDGFLVWGRLTPAVVKEVLPVFVPAFKRRQEVALALRDRFIMLYAELALFHVADVTLDFIRPLFEHGSLEHRRIFAARVRYFLGQMSVEAKQQLWDRWLFSYWRSRVDAIPAELADVEIHEMMQWLPHLGGAFPLAVEQLIRGKATRMEARQLLYQLRDSELVTRFASATAELIIYLCKCSAGYHAVGLSELAARLPPLEPDLKHRVDEALAFIGGGG